MKSRNKKLLAIGLAVVGLGMIVWLVLNAFRNNLEFYYTPTQVAEGKAPHGRAFRVGGLVKKGSIERSANGMTIRFVITDTARDMDVLYSVKKHGPLPDLFKAGKGAVIGGELGANGIFDATQVLAKHNENYMPPEAAAAIKEAQQSRKAALKQ